MDKINAIKHLRGMIRTKKANVALVRANECLRQSERAMALASLALDIQALELAVSILEGTTPLTLDELFAESEGRTPGLERRKLDVR